MIFRFEELAMTTKTKSRDRLHGGATQRTSDTRNHTGQDPLTGWFSLAKSSRINRQQKRGWQRGGNDIQPY
jgi:predicted phage gp36 major capsid-like protein